MTMVFRVADPDLLKDLKVGMRALSCREPGRQAHRDRHPETVTTALSHKNGGLSRRFIYDITRCGSVSREYAR